MQNSLQPNNIPTNHYFPFLVHLKQNPVKQYSWGHKNTQCYVASFSQANNKQNYAQLWMGCHHNGQSKLNENQTLTQYLEKNKKRPLNFLFKILSIEKCLSIQVHPNKQQAQKLHNSFPHIYKDPNDKPQLFLTLSEQFQLFLGFIKEQEFNQLIKKKPFCDVVQSLKLQIQGVHLMNLLRVMEKLLQLDEKEVEKHIQILFNQFIKDIQTKKANVLKNLNKQFPNDVGILISCLLQYRCLPKGSCFGIEAGVPHAYIKGQCFQLMNNSDNVVRAGLTPKMKDTKTLLNIMKENIQNQSKTIEGLKKDNETVFSWNGFEIHEISLLGNKFYLKINLSNESIGVVFETQTQISITKQQTLENPAVLPTILLKQKDIFYIEEGNYLFSGNGKIYIALKSIHC